MKVALINPKGTIFSKNKRMAEFLEQSVSMGSFRHFWSAPNLGLLTVAAYFPKEWEVEYIDEVYREIEFDKRFDIVFLSVMTVQAVRAYEIIEKYKKLGILTVIGGIHATILPEEAMQHADVTIAGEGERLIKEFVRDYEQKQIKKLYQDHGQESFNLLECIPPEYQLIHEYEYPIVNLYTTRGCPRNCSFCCASNVYGRNYRRKSNEQILSEIDLINGLYPDKLLLFADDNLFVKRRESKELLLKMLDKDVRWIAQTDISIADDEELLDLMYRSGCQWIVIGFESLSKHNLKELGVNNFKQKYLSSYEEKIQKIYQYGIKIYGTFIVGLDGDDTSVFKKTSDFIIDNHLYGANITVPTPLPGTAFRETMKQNNQILSYCWDDYTLWDVVIRPKQMSVKELEDGLLWLYKELFHQDHANERLRKLHKEIRVTGKTKERSDPHEE